MAPTLDRSDIDSAELNRLRATRDLLVGCGDQPHRRAHLRVVLSQIAVLEAAHASHAIAPGAA